MIGNMNNSCLYYDVLSCSNNHYISVSETMAQRVDQVSRWCFTFNNYDARHNYKDDFTNNPLIKRAVWGYEVAPQTGTPHLQGYLEFKRSQRLQVCNRILPRARWINAVANARTNYEYCIKSGRYDTVGDWTVGGIVPVCAGTRPATVPLIIAGVLNPTTFAQTKASKEYSDNHNYFDKVAKLFTKIKNDNIAFNKWQGSLLYPWQFVVSCIWNID